MTQDINNYDRVTSVLFPFSGLCKIDPAVLKNAANRGTEVHLHCDCIIKDVPLDEVNPDYQGYIDSFKLWADGKKFLPNPDRFFCEELMITGECDGLYEESGHIILFDIKTPLRESSTWAMQAAAYAYLAEQHGFSISRLEFVKLNKNGTKPIVYVYGDQLTDFLMCLQVYRKYFKKDVQNDLTDF